MTYPLAHKLTLVECKPWKARLTARACAMNWQDMNPPNVRGPLKERIKRGESSELTDRSYCRNCTQGEKRFERLKDDLPNSRKPVSGAKRPFSWGGAQNLPPKKPRAQFTFNGEAYRVIRGLRDYRCKLRSCRRQIPKGRTHYINVKRPKAGDGSRPRLCSRCMGKG